MEILTFPHHMLRRKCLPTMVLDKALICKIKIMMDCLIEEDIIGLAANQMDIGVSLRFFVMQRLGKPEAFINPDVIPSRDQTKILEGCTSFPDLWADVTRSTYVTMTWDDLEGKQHRWEFANTEARLIQHLMDHLDGIVFLDHVPAMARCAEFGKSVK